MLMKVFVALCVFAYSHFACAETEWEKYLAYPTSQQAVHVNKIEHSFAKDEAGGDQELQILQNQVLAQDAQAFRLAYRLYQSADGGLAEDLGALLARTIRVNPLFFLRQVATLNVPCSKIAWVLNTPGLEYTDLPSASHYEIQMRRKALNGVKVKELSVLRDQCLKALHDD